jgi:hypothetical protein
LFVEFFVDMNKYAALELPMPSKYTMALVLMFLPYLHAQSADSVSGTWNCVTFTSYYSRYGTLESRDGPTEETFDLRSDHKIYNLSGDKPDLAFGDWSSDGKTFSLAFKTNGGLKGVINDGVLEASGEYRAGDNPIKHKWSCKATAKKSETPSEKVIEFFNNLNIAKLVEFRDGAAGTGDSCNNNDYITSAEIQPGKSKILSCGSHVGFCFRWKYFGADDPFGSWIGASCVDHQFDANNHKLLKF